MSDLDEDAEHGHAAGEGSGGGSFTELHESSMTTEVVMGCWCPTMDLLALVAADGQLSIHRLDWHKLWLACPDVAITQMCWRPDGGLHTCMAWHGMTLYMEWYMELYTE